MFLWEGGILGILSDPPAGAWGENVSSQGDNSNATVCIEAYEAPILRKTERVTETAKILEGDRGESGFYLDSVFDDKSAAKAVSTPSEMPSYFAILIIQGVGEERILEREEAEAFLEELNANGIIYTYRTQGDDLEEESELCLVCYESELP